MKINLKTRRGHLEDLYIYGWVGPNIKTDLKRLEWNDMDWIHLAQVRVHWQALVNTEMNLGVPKMAGFFSTS
jgi:hypothetical protein